MGFPNTKQGRAACGTTGWNSEPLSSRLHVTLCAQGIDRREFSLFQARECEGRAARDLSGYRCGSFEHRARGTHTSSVSRPPIPSKPTADNQDCSHAERTSSRQSKTHAPLGHRVKSLKGKNFEHKYKFTPLTIRN